MFSSARNSFNCDQCGLCCSHIKYSIEGFPYRVVDGVCEMLNSNNKCKVYHNRPIMCNVSKYASSLHIPQDLFFEEQNKACKFLKARYWRG